MQKNDYLNSIQELLGDVNSVVNDICLIVVANVKGEFDPKDGTPTAQATTEYFSDLEIAQLLEAFRASGLFVRFIPNELSFIRCYLNGEFDSISQPLKLVYSTAQSGVGPGRKSLVPAFCRLIGYPVCNSDAYVLSLVRHKYHVYSILNCQGVCAPPSWVYIGRGNWLGDKRPHHGMTLIAKLMYESASVGLENNNIGVINSAFLDMLEEKSAKFNQPMIVQKFISGLEVEVPVLDISGGLPLMPVSMLIDDEYELGGRILDYERIALDNYQMQCIPAIADQFGEQIITSAKKAVAALGIKGIGRVDFRIDEDGEAFVSDVSTTPHLVKHGSFYTAFKELGFSHMEMLLAMVAINARNNKWI